MKNKKKIKKKSKKHLYSLAVTGFEPAPSLEDCDLNAAP